jgi:pimeloyl-ACP methyl ester carboxylesterase
MQDAAAPPENARLLAEKYGDRITVAEISGAGHAMLPERPAAIAEIIVNYLRP